MKDQVVNSENKEILSCLKEFSRMLFAQPLFLQALQRYFQLDWFCVVCCTVKSYVTFCISRTSFQRIFFQSLLYILRIFYCESQKTVVNRLDNIKKIPLQKQENLNSWVV
eukprot:TRINITY_DN45501_c1_g3_i1.p3 TRINITY_DN45501_c1_g3~~TRINITY_DN45501_c1_g3_i1.p3  ORF type:complete len:120 (-),score=0.29 TRINITY_DN45501_c1_g3_i1:669-998(-)